MIGLYNAYDHEAPEQVLALSEELKSMEKNEAFYLDLKKRIEAENQELLHANNDFKALNEKISDELILAKQDLSRREYEYDSVKSQLIVALDQIEKLQASESSLEVISDYLPEEVFTPLVSQEFLTDLTNWANLNSTLAFPQKVEILERPVVVSDLTLSASIEIPVGENVMVTRFHPVSENYVVAQQLNSDLFMASVAIENTNLMEKLAEKYVAHMASIGKKVINPFTDNRFSQTNQLP